jgi:hypothetical protein
VEKFNGVISARNKMILQLNPPIPVTCPKGAGYALFLIDYGQEHHLMWTIAMNDTGEIWTYANPHVRAQKNVTMDRLTKTKSEEIISKEYESHGISISKLLSESTDRNKLRG